MSSETIDLTIETFLPKVIKSDWLPLDGAPVPHLFHFKKYPPSEMPYYDSPDFTHLLHEEGLTKFELETLLQVSPPPSKLIDKYKDAIRTASPQILSFTLVPLSGNQVRFPTWVLDYWREIKRAMGYYQDWKKALAWLKAISQSKSMVEMTDQVMVGLSYFPWNGRKCTVHDMVSLLTNSWLSDFHIDYTLIKISNHYQHHSGSDISSHNAFLSVMDISAICGAYESHGLGGNSTRKHRQLLEVENKIITGHIKSAAGVLHIPGHWTSIVIEFNPPKIYFGDSLGKPMPTLQLTSFQRWICHMHCQAGGEFSFSDISTFPLPTSIQNDPNSCGLFALNSIGHKFLPEKFPLLKSDALSLACSRMEIALGLLQDDAVSDFHTTVFTIKLLMITDCRW
jgi:hypothetical protein